jgi:hypothetical protein
MYRSRLPFVFSVSEKSPSAAENESSVALEGEKKELRLPSGVRSASRGLKAGIELVRIIEVPPWPVGRVGTPVSSPILLQKSSRIVFSGTRYHWP